MEFYIVQESFYEEVSCHSQLLHHLSMLTEEQQAAIIQKPDSAQLYESATIYFGQPIEWYHDALILHDELQNQQHRIICNTFSIHVDALTNPFLSLLKRKYPRHILLHQDF